MISGPQKSQVLTFGQIFADGSIVELLADSANAGGLSLLLWDGAVAKIARQVEHLGQCYAPASVDPTIVRAIRFPNMCAPFESTQKFWGDICGVIKKFTGLPDKIVSLACASVFASWFVDCAPNPVCLSIYGPRSSQVSQLLRILGSLYRRALTLGAGGLAAICSLPMDLRPSLLIDKSEIDPPFLKFLRASSARDSFVAINGELRSIFCAKAIYTEDPIVDSALLHTVIPIPVTPMSQVLPILDDRLQQQIADEFQPKLLNYRLTNLHAVQNSEFDVPELFTPVRELARCLGSCVADDAELQARMVGLFFEQDAQLRIARSTNVNAVVVEAMLFACHTEKKHSVHIGEVADAVNTILHGRGEELELTPKAVASRLRNFGIVSERLDAAGRGIVMLNSVRERVHELARDLAVPTVRAGISGCRQCQEAQREISAESEG